MRQIIAYILVFLAIHSLKGMARDTFVIDTQKKTFKLTATQKETLEQCETIRYQQEKSGSDLIDFSQLNHSFLTKNKLQSLVKVIHNPLLIDNHQNKTLFPLLLAADYLDAPEPIRERLAIKTLAKLRKKKLSDQEKQIKKHALQNGYMHLSALIEKYYPELLQMNHYKAIELYGTWELPTLIIKPENTNFSDTRILLKLNEKIYDIRSAAFPIFKNIESLALRNQEIQDFCLAELVVSMPKLRKLDLCHNKIQRLTAAQLDGMPTTFTLDLSDNPILPSGIEADYFTNERFKKQNKSRIILDNMLHILCCQADKFFLKKKTYCSDALYKKATYYLPPALASLLAGTALYMWLINLSSDFKSPLAASYDKNGCITHYSEIRNTIQKQAFAIWCALMISLIPWECNKQFNKLPPHHHHMVIITPLKTTISLIAGTNMMSRFIFLCAAQTIFAMAPDSNIIVIDSQQKIFKLTAEQKEAFEQCKTVRYQQEGTSSSLISFSQLDHSFLTNEKLWNLIQVISDPSWFRKLKNNKLFSLLFTADYLDAPDSLRKKLGEKVLSD